MEPVFRTGNETVDRLSRIHISGNVIPQAWYKTIRKETGKPYLNAIVILSDIVYWYRAAEIRDEGSGDIIGYRKRFKANLLQRSYQQLADQFGITKRDATNAIVALEKLNVVKRVFRTLQISGLATPNVLFLELDVDILERLTYPEEACLKAGGSGSCRESVEQNKEAEESRPAVKKEGCHRFEGDIPPKKGRGVTRMSRVVSPNKGIPPTETGDTNTEITYKDYDTDYPILSYQRVKEAFKRQIEYDILAHDLNDSEELKELVDLAVEILTSNAATIRVNREDKPAEMVKEQYWRLNIFHIRYVLNSLSQMGTKAKNIRAVMVTALYNAVNTIETYYGNMYRHNEEIR